MTGSDSRRALFDGAVAAALAIVSGLLIVGVIDRPAMRFTAGVIAAVHVGSLLKRRRWPIGVVLVMLAAALATVPAGVPIVVLGPAIVVGVYTLGAYAEPRRAQLVLGATLLVMAVVVVANDGGLSTVVSNTAGLCLAWWLGDRSRRGALETGAARQAAVDAAHRAAVDERMRIARELHDVVAHSMTVIAVKAGAARFAAPPEATETVAAFAAIERTSRDALEEMRRLLTVLRGDGVDSALAPAPRLGDVADLVATAATAGVTVDVVTTGEARPLPAGVDLCAYRIVQEALTNVSKHARAPAATVRLAFEPQELRIEVLDDGVSTSGGEGSGHGLIGMRERVALYGGTFEAGPRRPRGFRVAATFPLGVTA